MITNGWKFYIYSDNLEKAIIQANNICISKDISEYEIVNENYKILFTKKGD